MALSEAARQFLNERRFATVATINADGTPQLSVMWYLLRSDMLIFNTEKDRRKARNLLRDRRMALCVEDEYRYVTVSGSVEIVDDPAVAQSDIRELTSRYKGMAAADEYYQRVFVPFERVSYYLPLDNVIEQLKDEKTRSSG